MQSTSGAERNNNPLVLKGPIRFWAIDREVVSAGYGKFLP
jgi:hypothetical protein